VIKSRCPRFFDRCRPVGEALNPQKPSASWIGWSSSTPPQTRKLAEPAEIELSLLSRQCLKQRVPDAETLRAEIDVWQAIRNADQARLHWSFRDPEFRLLLATLVIHYWKHAGFISGDGILANMRRISHIPGSLIHGRWDINSPSETAWELHKVWSASELFVVDFDGHDGETMFDELTRAVARSRVPTIPAQNPLKRLGGSKDSTNMEV
jgi:hypothetical protein